MSIAKFRQQNLSHREAPKNTGVPVSNPFEDQHHDQKTTSSA